MNAKELVKALKPLEGYRITIFSNTTATTRDQSCIEVRELQPDERQDNQGNVILYNGLTDFDGAPSGLTITAGNVQDVTWIAPATTIQLTGKSGKTATIAILYELLAGDN